MPVLGILAFGHAKLLEERHGPLRVDLPAVWYAAQLSADGLKVEPAFMMQSPRLANAKLNLHFFEKKMIGRGVARGPGRAWRAWSELSAELKTLGNAKWNKRSLSTSTLQEPTHSCFKKKSPRTDGGAPVYCHQRASDFSFADPFDLSYYQDRCRCRCQRASDFCIFHDFSSKLWHAFSDSYYVRQFVIINYYVAGCWWK